MSFRILSHIFKASVPLTRGHLFSNSLGQCLRYKSEFVIRAFGVPFSSTRTAVKDFFQGCDIVGEEKGIHRVYNEKGDLSGNTYIELASDEDVEKALERNDEYMGERCIKVQRSDEGSLNSVFRSKTGHMVRIWGFDFNATIEDVNLFLSPLIPAEVALKRGWCLVDFHTDEDVQAALSKDKEYMGQRFVRTEYA